MPHDLGFRQYWARVFRDAFLEALSWFGRPLPLFTGAVLAVVVVVVMTLTNQDVMQRVDTLIVSLQSIAFVAVMWFLIALVRAPWRINRSQQHDIAELTATRNALAEEQKPKLVFIFDPDCCPMWGSDSWGGQTYFVRIGVRNISRVVITGAVAYLSYLDSRKLRLPLPMGGGNDPQTLNPTNQHAHISFFMSDAPFRHELDTVDPLTGFDISLEPGLHVAHVSVESVNAPPIGANVLFSVTPNIQTVVDFSVTPLPD